VLTRPYEGPIVPEAMGAIAGTAYLAGMFLFIPFAFYDGAAGLKVRCLRNCHIWRSCMYLNRFVCFSLWDCG